MNSLLRTKVSNIPLQLGLILGVDLVVTVTQTILQLL
jgi:hypothetical protein